MIADSKDAELGAALQAHGPAMQSRPGPVGGKGIVVFQCQPQRLGTHPGIFYYLYVMGSYKLSQ